MSTIKPGLHKCRRKLEPLNTIRVRSAMKKSEIAVEYCGICHSDLSLLNNDWGMTPTFVPAMKPLAGCAMGPRAKGVSSGQRVGVAGIRIAAMHCKQCLMGNPDLCESLQPTLIGRHGAFAP